MWSHAGPVYAAAAMAAHDPLKHKLEYHRCIVKLTRLHHYIMTLTPGWAICLIFHVVGLEDIAQNSLASDACVYFAAVGSAIRILLHGAV